MFLLFNTLRPKPEPEPPAAVADLENGQPDEAAEIGAAENATANSDDEQSENSDIDRPETARLVTLGSMDPADGYSLLVTLNTRGGGIERIEVTHRNAEGNLKYRRVDVRHGYLGYLGTRNALDKNLASGGGAEISVVGPGTPAATAGLQIGDVIQTINGQSVSDEDSIVNELLKTRPGDTAEVVATRGGESKTFPVVLTEHPLDLVRLATTAGIDQVVGNETHLSCLMKLATVGSKSIGPSENNLNGVTDASELIWNLEQDDIDDQIGAVAANDEGDVTVKLRCPMAASETGAAATTLSRSYTLHRGSYVLDMDVSVTNDGESPQDLAYRLEGPNGVTMEGWWYSNKITRNFLGGSAARDIIYDLAGEGFTGFDERLQPAQTCQSGTEGSRRCHLGRRFRRGRQAPRLRRRRRSIFLGHLHALRGGRGFGSIPSGLGQNHVGSEHDRQTQREGGQLFVLSR